jgi:tetratricopeptide (TPR) repeat protein
MKQRAGLYLCVTALLFASACAACATGGGRGGQDGFDEAGISARGAVGRLDALSGPLWTGEGGKDIRLAVLAPEALGGAPGYLPMYIQGLLNSNLKRHSAMTLIDRQNLDRIIGEQKLSASGLYSDKDLVNIGKLTNAQYLLAGSLQKLSGSAYALQLSVTEVSSGEHKAVFTGNGSLSQIEGSGLLINRASAELLEQLGVTLTEAGRLSLMGGNTFTARAENAYAKGVAAQATGDQLEALFSYAQAASFDPGQLEALARLGTLSSTISGGSISERIMNDIQARDRWLEVFKETARFYSEHPPYELIFDPSLDQEGETDYVKRTAVLLMRVGLFPSEAGFAALNALLEGLEQTGRRGTWGFNGWPMEELNPKVNGTRLFSGKNATSFAVEVLLLNDKQKPVGKGSVTLNAGQLAAPGNKSVTLPEERFDTIRFQNVKADELSPVLTIVINSVNGIPSRTLSSSGYMRIAPGDLTTPMAEQAAAAKAQAEAERVNRQGNVYYAQGNYDWAVESYTEAVRLAPDNALYTENLAKARVAAEQAAAQRRAAEAQRQAAEARRATEAERQAAWKSVKHFFTYDQSFIGDLNLSLFTGYSSNYGWELAAYPEIGVTTGPFWITIFGGGGRSYSEGTWSPWTRSFGGHIAVNLGGEYADVGLNIGAGGGMAGPSLTDNGSSLYPFVRASLGLGVNNGEGFSTTPLKLYYDYNFYGNGYKMGLLINPVIFYAAFVY